MAEKWLPFNFVFSSFVIALQTPRVLQLGGKVYFRACFDASGLAIKIEYARDSFRSSDFLLRPSYFPNAYPSHVSAATRATMHEKSVVAANFRGIPGPVNENYPAEEKRK